MLNNEFTSQVSIPRPRHSATSLPSHSKTEVSINEYKGNTAKINGGGGRNGQRTGVECRQCMSSRDRNAVKQLMFVGHSQQYNITHVANTSASIFSSEGGNERET